MNIDHKWIISARKRAPIFKTSQRGPHSRRLRFERLEQRQLLTTFYVATNGNDNNPGTEARPMASLNHAQILAKAGDTVYLESGTYQWTALWWQQSGAAGAPIVISSAPGDSAIISGRNMPAQGFTFGVQASYVIVENLTITDARGSGLGFYQAKNCTAYNVTVDNSQNIGIQVGDSADSTMLLTQGDAVENCTVYNNSLENSPAERTANSAWGAGISVSGARDITLSGNSVYQNYGEGIDIICANVCSVQTNTIHDNFSVECYLDNAVYTTVQNNFIYCGGNSAYYRYGVGAIGISLANEVHSFQNLNNYNRIQDNIVEGGSYGFVAFDSYGLGYAFRDTLVINNTFYDAKDSLVDIQNSRGTNVGNRIANNIFEQTGGAAVIAVFQSGGVSYDHNLWWGGNGNNGGMNGVGDVKKNPLLTAPGGSSVTGYQPAHGSPAIGAGTATGAPSWNFWWKSRGNSINIGAW